MQSPTLGEGSEQGSSTPTHLQLLHGHLLAMFLAALNEDVQGIRVVFALGTLQLLTDSLLEALLKDLPSLDALGESGSSALPEGRTLSKRPEPKQGSRPIPLPPLPSPICSYVLCSLPAPVQQRVPPKGSPVPSLCLHRILTLR